MKKFLELIKNHNITYDKILEKLNTKDCGMS